jgi:hypothetical protein
MTDRQVEAAAAAIANTRAGRKGAPPISNVLELLRSSPRLMHLYTEIMEDARAALEALRCPTRHTPEAQ